MFGNRFSFWEQKVVFLEISLTAYCVLCNSAVTHKCGCSLVARAIVRRRWAGDQVIASSVPSRILCLDVASWLFSRSVTVAGVEMKSRCSSSTGLFSPRVVSCITV